ncbi:MAG: hypothetical protein IPN09_06480 [Bacteroidetes bacterium]|nr:hypothetical protein [Bacteroidota bacterium]
MDDKEEAEAILRGEKLDVRFFVAICKIYVKNGFKKKHNRKGHKENIRKVPKERKY